jgi:glutamate racemase
MTTPHPIGIFDSGFGGLTVLSEIEALLPEYDYLYLGDNARTPYGNRSFSTVYNYTLQAVKWLFTQECPLVILACNTASAKALRTIQQTWLPDHAPDKRVLGVLRPVTEYAGTVSKSGHVGIFGTRGTVESGSYVIELEKYFPGIKVTQEACPIWVPLVENGEAESDGTDYFIRQHIERLFDSDPDIDTIVLGCTHYPLLQKKIESFIPEKVTVISQGTIVAHRLKEYLSRHPEIASRCTTEENRHFRSTEKPAVFERSAAIFYGSQITCGEVDLSATF